MLEKTLESLENIGKRLEEVLNMNVKIFPNLNPINLCLNYVYTKIQLSVKVYHQNSKKSSFLFHLLVYYKV